MLVFSDRSLDWIPIQTGRSDNQWSFRAVAAPPAIDSRHPPFIYQLVYLIIDGLLSVVTGFEPGAPRLPLMATEIKQPVFSDVHHRLANLSTSFLFLLSPLSVFDWFRLAISNLCTNLGTEESAPRQPAGSFQQLKASWKLRGTGW